MSRSHPNTLILHSFSSPSISPLPLEKFSHMRACTKKQLSCSYTHLLNFSEPEIAKSYRLIQPLNFFFFLNWLQKVGRAITETSNKSRMVLSSFQTSYLSFRLRFVVFLALHATSSPEKKQVSCVVVVVVRYPQLNRVGEVA